jgi:hypothetical protein
MAMKRLIASALTVGLASVVIPSCNSADPILSTIELSSSARNSGIEGLVLRGPIHGGPIQAGEISERGFKALFYVLRDEKPVTTFQSTEDGFYHVSLAPGIYNIIPDSSSPIMSAARQVKEVTVKEKQITIDTLHFDTGLR